jgi:hypothetical protein
MKMLLMMTVLTFMAIDVAADPDDETLIRAHAGQIARFRMAARERLQATIERRQQEVVNELLISVLAKPLPRQAAMEAPAVMPLGCASVSATCDLPWRLPCLVEVEETHFAKLGVD